MQQITRIDGVRNALFALQRGLKRVAIYRHDTAHVPEYVAPAHAALSAFLDAQGAVELSVGPGGLSFEGESVLEEPVRDGSMCFRLFRDGVRRLSFLPGLTLEEVAAFAGAALPDGSGRGGQEDAVTELWKADLRGIRFEAEVGWKGDDAGEAWEGAAGRIAIERTRAMQGLAQVGHADEASEEIFRRSLTALDPTAITGVLRPSPWDDLATRCAHLLASIARTGQAGPDAPALAESFALLAHDALGRGATAAIRALLSAADELQHAVSSEEGKAAAALMLERLAEELGREGALEQLIRMALESPPFAAAFVPALPLLPAGCGAALLEHMPAEGSRELRQALARAAARRAAGLESRWQRQLASAPAPVALELLSAVPTAAFEDPGAIALAALEHPSPSVQVAAVPIIAFDARHAVERLARLLSHPSTRIRIAAARELATSPPAEAAPVLLAAIGRADERGCARDELEVLCESLGALRTEAGHAFLAAALASRPSIFLRRRPVEELQLAAVHGIAAENSPRALAILERESDGPRRAAHDPVAAACRAAARALRAHLARPEAA